MTWAERGQGHVDLRRLDWRPVVCRDHTECPLLGVFWTPVDGDDGGRVVRAVHGLDRQTIAGAVAVDFQGDGLPPLGPREHEFPVDEGRAALEVDPTVFGESEQRGFPVGVEPVVDGEAVGLAVEKIYPARIVHLARLVGAGSEAARCVVAAKIPEADAIALVDPDRRWHGPESFLGLHLPATVL